MKKVILSGVRPSARPHIGNYFGAMKQFVDMQYDEEFKDANRYFMVADMHTLDANKGENMRKATMDVVLDYLAIGIDPKISKIFIQSHTAYHSELAMIFSYLTTVPYLMRGHLYKEYDVEYFNEPKEYLIKDMQLVPGIDGRKMSKSYGNHIPLFSTREEIEKLVKKIVTDSGVDTPENVYAIHKLVRDEKELKNIYEENKGKYKILKDILIEDLDTFIKPFREKRAKLEAQMDYVLEVLKEGNEATGALAAKKMKEVKDICGLGLVE